MENQKKTISVFLLVTNCNYIILNDHKTLPIQIYSVDAIKKVDDKVDHGKDLRL